jgi:integrase/recombinase XerD
MKPAIQNQFDQYLTGKGHTLKTRQSIIKEVRQFEKWATSENIGEISSVTYADVLLYIKHCTGKGNVKKTISLKLLFLRHLYDFLLKDGQVRENPLTGIQVQGIKRNTLHAMLTREELDKLYQDYQHPGLPGKRNKVILGLLVHQGLRTEEIAALQVTDINLKEGKISISGSRRTNERVLVLQPVQVMEILEYIREVRPVILQQAGKTGEQLFVSAGSGDSLQNTFQYLADQLKALDSRIKKISDIRASVITGWLKLHNLRQVQHMAGHRYVSSTEKYKVNDLEGLIEDIGKYHPL